ncbi:hypothetical protein D9M71_657670 [compost metagenome]
MIRSFLKRLLGEDPPPFCRSEYADNAKVYQELLEPQPPTVRSLQLELRVDGETGKPFICDQDGRRMAGMLRFTTNVETFGEVASVNLTAQLFANGKKYVASGSPRHEVKDGD